MGTLEIIGLLIVAIILLIGVFRVIFSQSDGVLNFLMELMLLDWMLDALSWIFETIGDTWTD